MTDEEIREIRTKALKDDLASINNRLHHAFNQGFELGRKSVTPKEKTGHWIGHREHCENLGVMPSGLGAYEWCSNCDCGIDVREWHRNHYNFCPNCGAKMIEPQESEG